MLNQWFLRWLDGTAGWFFLGVQRSKKEVQIRWFHKVFKIIFGTGNRQQLHNCNKVLFRFKNSVKVSANFSPILWATLSPFLSPDPWSTETDLLSSIHNSSRSGRQVHVKISTSRQTEHPQQEISWSSRNIFLLLPGRRSPADSPLTLISESSPLLLSLSVFPISVWEQLLSGAEVFAVDRWFFEEAVISH